MENNNKKIAVSIIVLAYNHEAYIREALDNMLNQETNFSYEILIHDDASQDDTQTIIKEYAAAYPEVIPVLQKENQYSQGINPLVHLIPMVKGDYIAACECDDYWTDSSKLQKQYDALEQYPECVACVHKVQTVNITGEKLERCFPDESFAKKSRIISPEEILLNEKYLFQTSSYFARSVPFFSNMQKMAILSQYFNGDECSIRVVAAEGAIYYLNESMSNYRIGVMGSWSTNNSEQGRHGYVQLLKKYIKGETIYDQITEKKFHQTLMQKNLRQLEILTFLDAYTAAEVLKENKKFFKSGLKRLPLKKRIKYILLERNPRVINMFMQKRAIENK